MISAPQTKRDGAGFVVQYVTGFEAFLYWLLPRSLFVRWVFRYLHKHKAYRDYVRLPDGSEWDRQYRRLD